MSRSDRVLGAGAVVITAVAVSACTTSYVGQKLGTDGKLDAADRGVPFTLTKPQYKVNITADPQDGTKAVYAIVAEDVPDATQRFTIALDPALLVDGKFDLDFSSHGSLAGAVATTTSRVVDTFGAVVAAALKLKSTSILDSVDTVNSYKEEALASTDPACTKRPSAQSSGTVGMAIGRKVDELLREARREVGDRKGAETAAADLVAARLFFANLDQRACMSKISEKSEERPRQRYQEAIKKAKDAAKDDASVSTVIREIEAHVVALDEGALQALANELSRSPAPFDHVFEAANQGKQLVAARYTGRFARSLSDMSSDVWRARRLADLERRIAEERLQSLLSPAADGTDQAAGALSTKEAEYRSAWALTIGEAPLYKDLERIEMTLVKSARGAADAPAANVIAGLRVEKTAIWSRLEQVRNDVLSKNRVPVLEAVKPKEANVEARANVPVAMVTQAYVDKVNAQPRSFRGLPEFVLVIRADTAGAITPNPIPAAPAAPAAPVTPAAAASAASAPAASSSGVAR